MVPTRAPAGARLLGVFVVPKPVPNHSRSSEFGLVLVGPPFEVHSVLRGSPADRAGIQPDDRILEIDGQKPETLGPEKLLDSLHLENGRPVVMRVQRGERTLTARILPPTSRSHRELQVGFTYARGKSMLVLTEYAAKAVEIRPPTGSSIKPIGGNRAVLVRLSKSVRLVWYARNLLLDIETTPGGFTEVEIISFARGLK
jgi:membrane-associated protease RseP (regulator of RpoE activity)